VNLHEYQARGLLKQAGIPVPDGEVAVSPDEVEQIAARMDGGVVVKAQVHAGGRGKAGGVKLAKDPKEARAHAEQILGMQIKGLTVEKVLVVPTSAIASESYVGVIVDRASERAVVMVSPAGGVDIEEVAAKTPEQIFKQSVDPKYGLLPHQAMSLAFNLYDDIKQVRQAAKIMQQLYQAFLNAGASLAEINPLITTPGGQVVALDAKIGVDDNELERRPNIAALRDTSSEAPAEVTARDAGLTYIKLDGRVGLLRRRAGQLLGYRRQQ
jgi:succinyl-CoA synthetase beta subunit